jgi:hypothetical protein
MSTYQEHIDRIKRERSIGQIKNKVDAEIKEPYKGILIDVEV